MARKVAGKLKTLGEVEMVAALSGKECLIDTWLPGYDFVSHHETEVNASPETVYAVARCLDMHDSILIRCLFRIRGFPATSLSLEELLRSGFFMLWEKPPQEFLIGLAGRFWKINGDLQHLDRESFQKFNKPGYAKAVWNFRMTRAAAGRTRLSTETRVYCLDFRSWQRFKRYWYLIRPFSGMIRREMLRTIKRRAESAGKMTVNAGNTTDFIR